METGLQLQAGTSLFPSSPSHSIEKLPHMTYILVWGCGMQAQITRLHCTCRDVRASSEGGHTCWSLLHGEGQASGGPLLYRDYVETRLILGEHGATSAQHLLSSCCNHWAFYIGCDPAWGVACQEGHNLEVCSLDTHTRNSHAAWDAVGRYTQGNLQYMLLKPVCNAWSWHLHREHCTTRSRRCDFVQRWEAGVPAGVLRSAPLGSFAAVHPAASEE